MIFAHNLTVQYDVIIIVNQFKILKVKEIYTNNVDILKKYRIFNIWKK